MGKPILFRNDALYLSYKFIASFGIPEQTISAWRRRKIGSRIYEGKEAYIDYSSIPDQTRWKLPPEAVIKATYRTQKAEILTEEITSKLESALSANYSKWFNLFKPKYPQLPTEKLREAAIKAVSIECVLQLDGDKGEKKAAFEAYNKVVARPYDSEHAFIMPSPKPDKKALNLLPLINVL
ncbi:hypothetical protein [Paraflavitalea speifideaquila]|uniref:hypothetical protein n=1 Tax=Paraflavitalea speifideaquila TaxID=3076558 RepID=UPI0028EB90A4|nr:hypothetical protein [Paraflavitalea speifideiaquila]